MATQLPAECFLALASIIYADGRARESELAAFRRAATSYGVSDDELTAILERAKNGATIEEVEIPALTKWQAALTYSFAVWVAKVDGIINNEELGLLRRLGDKLELEPLRRDAARSATYDIAALPGGHKPELYDFEQLEAKLEAKLPGSFRANS